MRTRTGILVVLGIVLAGCGTAASPSAPSPVTSSTPPQEVAAVTTAPTPDAPTAAATPRPTPATPPPPPTAVRITREGCYTGPDGDGVPSGVCTQTVTWNEAVTKGTEIRVYGVTRCILQTQRAGDGQCLGKHTPVPAALRKLIARAPASKGSVELDAAGLAGQRPDGQRRADLSRIRRRQGR